MNYREKISSDHRIMLGKPVITGTRITVELVLRKMSEGATTKDLLLAYSFLTEDDILAVLMYASDVVAKEEILEIA